MSKIIDVDFKSKTIKNVTHQNKEINEANEDKINNDIPQNQEQTVLPKSHQDLLNKLYVTTLKHMQEVREAIKALGYDDQVSAQATVAMIEDCIDELWDNGVPIMSRLYKNWFIHNMLSHPISEIVYWVTIPFGKQRAETYCNAIHDFTLPEVLDNGRG